MPRAQGRSQQTFTKKISLTPNSVEVLEVIESLSKMLILVPVERSLGEKNFILHAKTSFNESLLWVVKHQTKVYRLKEPPFNLESVQFVKSQGEVLNAFLNLCYASMDFVDEFGSSTTLGYKNAVEWWCNCVIEIFSWTLQSISEPPTANRKIERAMKEDCQKLDDGINPYLPDEAEWRHCFTLFEIAISISKQQSSDNNDLKRARRKFRDGPLKQFKDCYKAIKSGLRKKGLGSLFLKNGAVYVQQAGRQSKKVLPPPQINKLGRRGRNAQSSS